MENKHLDVGAARIDVEFFRKQIHLYAPDGLAAAADVRDLITAADSLLAALNRVEALEASRIGADDYLRRNPETNSVDFYAGVSFALAKVRGAIRAEESQ